MATEPEQLTDDLLSLPTESRASSAHSLVDSLDEDEDINVEDLWIEEVRRRDQAHRLGMSSMKPADQVLRAARERLRCMK